MKCSGIVLIVALLMLTILTLLSIEILTILQFEFKLTSIMKTEQEIFHAAEIGLEHIEQLLRENREITCLYPEKNSYYFIELPASGWESNAVCHEIVMSVKIDAVLESFLRNDCIVIVKKPLKDQKTMKKIAQLYRITVRANKDSLAEAQFIQTVYATATDEESSCESSNQRLIELGRVSWREV